MNIFVCRLNINMHVLCNRVTSRKFKRVEIDETI